MTTSYVTPLDPLRLTSMVPLALSSMAPLGYKSLISLTLLALRHSPLSLLGNGKKILAYK